MMNENKMARVLYTRLPKLKTKDGISGHEAAGKLLSYGLFKYCGIRLSEETLAAKEHGKPYLAGHPEIEFNISHSGDYVVVALSGSPVGIDIQEKRVTDIDKLGKKIFSPPAYRAFLASSDRQDAFFREWVRKESYVKMTGEGLLTQEIADIQPGGWSCFIHIDNDYYCMICADKPLEIRIEEVLWKTFLMQ